MECSTVGDFRSIVRETSPLRLSETSRQNERETVGWQTIQSPQHGDYVWRMLSALNPSSNIGKDSVDSLIAQRLGNIFRRTASLEENVVLLAVRGSASLIRQSLLEDGPADRGNCRNGVASRLWHWVRC